MYVYANPSLPIPPTPSSVSCKYVQVFLQNKPFSQWTKLLKTKQTNQQITVFLKILLQIAAFISRFLQCLPSFPHMPSAVSS